MIVALIDNGSLAPAAHRHLRAVAAALSHRAGLPVHAVSWKHSDRLPAGAIAGAPASTLATFVRSQVALGQRHFVFVPFFLSPQGAIGSALRRDLEALQGELGGFEFTFTAGLAARGVIPTIVATRIRETISARALGAPLAIVVDHGGPSAASAQLRDELAEQVRAELGTGVSSLDAASMEGAHPPLLAVQLRPASYSGRDVVIAPLFLSPGRHAGPDGDVAQICRASGVRCHLTELVGTHPLATTTLVAALQHTLSTLHDPTFA